MEAVDGRESQQSGWRQAPGSDPVQSKMRFTGTRRLPATRVLSRSLLLSPGEFQGKNALEFPLTRIRNALAAPGLQIQTGPKWTHLASKKGFSSSGDPTAKLTLPPGWGELKSRLPISTSDPLLAGREVTRGPVSTSVTPGLPTANIVKR